MGRADPHGSVGSFDRLSLSLATRISRRSLLRGFLLTLGGLLTYGIVGCGEPPDPDTCPVPCGGDCCDPGTACVDGACVAPNDPFPCPVPCGGDCCDPGTVCVGGACVVPNDGISGHVGSAQFWARADGDSRSEARYSLPGLGDVLVLVRGEDQAELVWNGITITGKGPLSAVQAEALIDLAEGPYRSAIVRVPLELGCAFGDLAPAVYAALVYPWQLMLKYLIQDREAHMRTALGDASCAYLPTLEQLAQNHPRPAFALVSWTLPFPYAFGFVPFDADGALEALPGTRPTDMPLPTPSAASVTPYGLPGHDAVHFERVFAVDRAVKRAACPSYTELRVGEYGPTGKSQCRHACGVDCPETCCQQDEWTCVVGSNGRYTGQAMLVRTYVCGVHQGCIDHDDCYDRCVSQYGDCLNAFGEPSLFCYDWDNFSCHRACDLQAVVDHGQERTLEWTEGRGEFTHYVAYRYDLGPQTHPETAPPLCLPGQCAPPGVGRSSKEEPPEDEECLP